MNLYFKFTMESNIDNLLKIEQVAKGYYSLIESYFEKSFSITNEK